MPELDSPEIFRSVLENLGTGVYIVDRNRKILFWNEGAENITGYLRQDVVGRLLRDQLLMANSESTKVAPDSDDPLNVVFRDGKSSINDVSILHKDGYRVPVVLHSKPIRDSRGAVIGAAESFDKNRSAFDRTRRQTAKAKIASLDEVTGIAGKTFMQTFLTECLSVFVERQAQFSILIIHVEQIDHFLGVCGPGVVPVILRVVARTIENSLRPTDLVGRWSDERFIVMLSECPENEVARVGDRIRKMIGNSAVEWWGDTFSVVAAFGGAGVRPGDILEGLVGRAERSLSESIAAGGNRVTVLA